MNRQEQLDAIKKACIAANPSKEWERESYHGDGTACSFEVPITLADVLLATERRSGLDDDYMLSSNGSMFKMDTHNGDFCFQWNLRADDLDQQSDTCIAFLADLLK